MRASGAGEREPKGARSNEPQLRALDAETPDREGWPCFGMAGDGVDVAATPIVWAPGQGVVRYPAASGIALSPRATIVLQVHYNLADPKNLGKSDQTRIRLELSDHVDTSARW
jgi:hypothetical protein